MQKLIRPLNISNFILMPGGSFFSRRGTQTHFASDYLVNVGSPVYASNTGRLRDASGPKCGIGAIIYGYPDSIYQTGYCHLSKFSPRVERELNKMGFVDVNQGDLIGYTGKTGNAQNTQPHLHFKVRNKNSGIPLDPEQLDYKRHVYGFPWFVVLFGLFSTFALVHAYQDEKRKRN